MTSSYPAGFDSFTNPTGTDNLSDSVGGRTHAAMHADVNDAVEAIQGALGTNPQGSYADVAARLSAPVTDALYAQDTAATITAARTTTSAVSSFVAMPENIVKVGDTYWILYTVATVTKTSLYLASATSPEGPWTAYGEVLTCGSLGWETQPHTNGGCLLFHEGTFYLFYSCDATSGAIGVATAAKVTGPYTKNADPILEVAASGWDSLRVQEPDVSVAPDGTWVMAYMAEDVAFTKGTTEKVGIATAPGPLGPWTKAAANPVVGFGGAGAWDVGGAADPSLLYDGGVWWCLYSGLSTGGAKPWRLGLAYASGPEGPWTKHPSNPILGPGAGGAFDANSVWRGAIFEEGGVYHLPYGGIPASADTKDAKAGSALITGLGASRVATRGDLGQFATRGELAGYRQSDTPIMVSDLASGAESSGRIMQADGSGGVQWADAPAGGGGGGSGAAPTAWANYTPTWTGATTDPSVGDGQIKGRYRKFGNKVEGRIEIVRGSTGAASGSGIYYLSLPPGITPATPVGTVSYAVGAGWVFTGTTVKVGTLTIDSSGTKFRAALEGSVWASSANALTTTGNLATFEFSFETVESDFGVVASGAYPDSTGQPAGMMAVTDGAGGWTFVAAP